jgi:hypothetical protein
VAEAATRAAAPPAPAGQNGKAAGLVLGGIAAFCVNDAGDG